MVRQPNQADVRHAPRRIVRTDATRLRTPAPSADGRIYVLGGEKGTDHGLFASIDAGAHWTRASSTPAPFSRPGRARSAGARAAVLSFFACREIRSAFSIA